VKYRTIVADPPWSYLNGSIPMGGVDKHFATMTNAEIAALPIVDLADEDAHLYLWVTNPRLFSQSHDCGIGPHEIMQAWGFRYITMLTWLKPGLGLGYYFRGSTEHVLFGVKGALPIPAPLRVANWFQAPRSEHSRKPEAFLDIVEQVSPAPRLELFARRARFGWDYWGDESLGTATLQTTP